MNVLAVLLAGVGVVIAALIQIKRPVQQCRRRRQRHEASAWAALMAVIDGSADITAIRPALHPAANRRVDALASSLVVNLKGADREALARLLHVRGVIAATRRRSRGWRAGDRARAAELLGAAMSTSAFPDLVRLLDDHSARVRHAAAQALGRTGDPLAAAPLLDAMEGRRALPLDLVVSAILQAGEPPANVLSHGLRSPSASIRAVTAKLLGHYQVLAATAELARTVASDDCLAVRLCAAGALGHMGTKDAGAALIACLDDKSAELRGTAVSALAHIGCYGTIEALREAVLAPPSLLPSVATRARATVSARPAPVLPSMQRGGSMSPPARQALDAHGDHRRRASPSYV